MRANTESAQSDWNPKLNDRYCVGWMRIYMKTSLNIYGKDQTTPNKGYSLGPLMHVPPPPLHSNTLVTIPEACARRSLSKDLPPLVIYTLSFLCHVCVAHGIVSNSLRQGQLSTFSWLQSTQSMCVIYTIQGSACQCLQHVGVDFLVRDVLRNGPH